MLMRVGGGKNARLSIPRDTIVDIPGHGRNKINAAYAIGGPALAVETIESTSASRSTTSIEVNFENFPQLIDAMGGITYKGGCVVSRINGGFKNGGYTLRLQARQDAHRRQAGARARPHAPQRLQPSASPTSPARGASRRSSSAMKSRLLSPFAFIRLPLIAWNTPKALRSPTWRARRCSACSARWPRAAPRRRRSSSPTASETRPTAARACTSPTRRSQRDVERFLRGLTGYFLRRASCRAGFLSALGDDGRPLGLGLQD